MLEVCIARLGVSMSCLLHAVYSIDCTHTIAPSQGQLILLEAKVSHAC